MTQKEKLATEYVSLKKELTGTKFNENIRDNQIWYLVKELKVIELKYKIDAVKRAIDQKNKKLAIEAYYNTDEGASYKAKYEKEIDELSKLYEKTDTIYKDIILDKIQEFLGDTWDANICFSPFRAYIEIGLKDDTNRYKLKFGHDFNISIEKSWKNDNFEVSMNYGTLGSFDPFNDTYRIEYLNGMSAFIKNGEILSSIVDYSKDATTKISEIDKKITEAKAKLENPEF